MSGGYRLCNGLCCWFLAWAEGCPLTLCGEMSSLRSFKTPPEHLPEEFSNIPTQAETPPLHTFCRRGESLRRGPQSLITARLCAFWILWGQRLLFSRWLFGGSRYFALRTSLRLHRFGIPTERFSCQRLVRIYNPHISNVSVIFHFKMGQILAVGIFCGLLLWLNIGTGTRPQSESWATK